MSLGIKKYFVIPQLPAVLLLPQAVISVPTELMAVPVTVTDPRGHRVSGLMRVASAVAGVVLVVGAVGAQSIATPSLKGDTPEPSVPRACRDVRPATDEAPIRRGVAPPSSDFTTYVEGELVRVSIPSNWRERPDSNAVTFAPDGADGSVGLKSVFTHGLRMGLARNDKRNLRETTSDFIRSYLHVNPRSGRTFRFSKVTIGDRAGLHTVLSIESEATGQPERIEIFTTLLRDGTMFYVLAVAPLDCASSYADTFRRVVDSIEIMDCDRCVR